MLGGVISLFCLSGHTSITLLLAQHLRNAWEKVSSNLAQSQKRLEKILFHIRTNVLLDGLISACVHIKFSGSSCPC